MGVIYCFKDKYQTIIYIGSTIRDPKKRYSEHTKATSELNRYIFQNGGFSNFIFEVLLHTEANYEELKFLERSYIEKYNPICNLRKPIAVHEEHQYYFYKQEQHKEHQQLEEECLASLKT